MLTKSEDGLNFSKKETCFCQNPVAPLNALRFKWVLNDLWKLTGLSAVAFGDSQCEFVRRKVLKFAYPSGLSWKTSLTFSEPLVENLSMWFSSTNFLLWSINKFEFFKTFLTSEALRTEKARKCKIFRSSLRIKPFDLQKYWLFFVHQGINRICFTSKELIDCQAMHLVSCNGNLMGQSSQKLSIVLIRLDIETQFPPKQLSRFFPSTSQSANLFLEKMIQYPDFLFQPFFDFLVGLNC